MLVIPESLQRHSAIRDCKLRRTNQINAGKSFDDRYDVEVPVDRRLVHAKWADYFPENASNCSFDQASHQPARAAGAGRRYIIFGIGIG